MSQRIYRLLFVVFVLAFSTRMFAQSEIGISLNGSQLDESRFDDGEEVAVDFDEGIGFGLTYNYFLTKRFSIEAAANAFGADMTVSEDGGPAENVGELSAAAITGMGLFHFNTDGRFSPYLGGGIAFIGGEFDPDDDTGLETIDLETDVTWTVALGANIRVSERVWISLESKYIEWAAKPEDVTEVERLDLDPLLLSAGIKFRF